MQFEWIGSGRSDVDNSQADPSRLLNWYRENLNGKMVLKSVLGTSAFASLDGAFMRAMAEIGGQIYAANAGKLWRVDSAGNGFDLGDIVSSVETTISSNNGKVTVAAGGSYYSFDGATQSMPATGAFSDVGSVSFIGQRTIITELDGRRVQWSGVADSETFDGLDFATAEQRDDSILRGVAIGGQYWIFKEKSIEQWYLTGAADSASFIAYRPGTLVDIGLKAFGLYTTIPNGGFFVGNDNIAYIVSGGQMKPISSRAVETAIKFGAPTHCHFSEDEGHKFCVIRFEDRPAWIYDLSMNEWHERAFGETFGRWPAVAAVKAYGGYFVGTETGEILKLERINSDAGGPLFCRGISGNLRNGGEYFSIDAVNFLATTGTETVETEVPGLLDAGDGNGLDAGPGSGLYIQDGIAYRGASVRFSLSKDRGKTFGREKARNLGILGDYDQEVVVRGWGSMKNGCVAINSTDAADISFETVAEIETS